MGLFVVLDLDLYCIQVYLFPYYTFVFPKSKVEEETMDRTCDNYKKNRNNNVAFQLKFVACLFYQLKLIYRYI